MFKIVFIKTINITGGSTITMSSRYLNRSNEVLDYIDCISNEAVPFGIDSGSLKENDIGTQNTNFIPPEVIVSKELANNKECNSSQGI